MIRSGHLLPTILIALVSLGNLSAQDSVRRGPVPVKPGEVGIGKMIPDLVFTDIHGARRQLSDYRDHKALVIAMTGTSCPLNLKYGPTLAALEQEYASQGFAFLFCDPTVSDSDEDILADIDRLGLQGAYVADRDRELAGVLQAQTTTEVFVLDSQRTLLYRGAVDDQYGIGYARNDVREPYLRRVLDGIVQGRSVLISATTAPGCELGIDELPAKTAVTYHNRISRIIQTHCGDCHHDGGLGPFDLTSPEDLKAHAAMVEYVVKQDLMPPWFAADLPVTEEESKMPRHHWANDRSLSAEEKQDLLEWLGSEQPLGDIEDAPLPRDYPEDWMIGEPDDIFRLPQPVPIQATGQMDYVTTIADHQLSEGKWIQAVEIRPSARAAVHHVLVFAIKPGEGRQIDEESGFLAAYVPGNSYQIYPDGYAKYVPAGARLVFQLHYTPIGKELIDNTVLGVKFAAEPPQHAVKNKGIANTRILIPAGAGNHDETAKETFDRDIDLLAFMPHMHLRGKAFKFERVDEQGNLEPILDIPRYDFNWQLEYRLIDPLTIKKGSGIKVTGWFDNSDDNPANPDPSEQVRWGKQTDNEMLIGYIEYVERGEDPAEYQRQADQPADRAVSPRAVLEQVFRRRDENGDGKLSLEELGDKQRFEQLDADKDGFVTLEEAAKRLGRRN